MTTFDQTMLISAVVAGAGILVLSMLLGAGSKKATAVWFVAAILVLGTTLYFGVNGLTLVVVVAVLLAAFWLASRILNKEPKK